MLHQLFHELLTVWFHCVENWGYWGVFFLMALESSIVPIPSEIVMPPAAFWAANGKMDFWVVVMMGTAGSYFGSVVNYFAAYALGRPILYRYGKYFLLREEKIVMAEKWLQQYGAMGIFLARLLPVIRHLISLPAGMFRMPFVKFSFATISGAFVWCWILSWFGQQVIGSRPDLLQSPEALIAVCRAKLQWIVIGVIILGFAYALVVRFQKRMLN